MLRCATHKDVTYIQSILNKSQNLDKLEAYPDNVILEAIGDDNMIIFVWEEHNERQGFCWLRQTNEDIKIEEFGVTTTGKGTGSRFFVAILEYLNNNHPKQPLWLAVAADNSGAIKFYEHFGFVSSELKKAVWKRRQGPIADALLMKYVPN